MRFFGAILFFGICLTLSAATAAEPTFICEPDKEWTTLFDRTEGWLAGDGIFSYGIDGNSRQGSANEYSKTIFHFSDSFFGNANADGSFKAGCVMVNHCFAVLTGNKPDPSKMQFIYKTNAEGRPANLFDKRFWLSDGIVIDSIIYTIGTVVDPKTWEMEGPWLISVPIQNNQPDFSKTETKPVNLFHKNGQYEVLFGIGIYNDGDDIYIYGFRNKKGVPFFPRQLVVAKVHRRSFNDTATWQFWTGKHWSRNIADCNSDDAALAKRMSNELSVTKMIGGRYDGKFILIYTEDCISTRLNFMISDLPYSRFSETTTFYHCPEPKQYEAEIKRIYGNQANLVTYNAKAHPRISKQGELIVSYNLNVFGIKDGMFFVTKKHGFPRFVRLKLP